MMGLEVLEESGDAAKLSQHLRVPPELACLEGHFASFPVLPGAAQMQWVLAAGARLAGRTLHPSRVEALKFRQLIRPGESFHAAAELARDGRLLRFTIEKDGEPVASGRFVLDELKPDLGRAEAFEPVAEPRPCSGLVPQSGPMLFLDRLLATNEKRTICGVRKAGGPFFQEATGALPAWVGLEPMAQCIAAHGGLYSPKPADGKPRVGFLLGCRRLEIGATQLSPEVAYAVSAVRLWGAELGLVSFDCELFEALSRRRLLAGRINAYLPEDLTSMAEGRLG